MANRTKAQLRTIVEYYLGGSTSYTTEINTFLDMAVESISFLHNFRTLRGMVEATLAENAYYLSMPTDFKENRYCMWLLSTTGESGKITWLPEERYHNMFQYPDYSARGTGTPRFYAKIGDYLYFNSMADKDYTIRLWYQKYHVAFTDDNTSHSFKPDYMAALAIVSWVLTETKDLLPLTDEGRAMAAKAKDFVGALIAADDDHAEESMDLEVYFDSDREGVFRGAGVDPYDWI